MGSTLEDARMVTLMANTCSCYLSNILIVQYNHSCVPYHRIEDSDTFPYTSGPVTYLLINTDNYEDLENWDGKSHENCPSLAAGRPNRWT